MNYALAIDNQEGSLTFGKEIVIPLTTLETPPMIACALRAYTKNFEGLKTFSEAWMEKPSKDFERIISVPEKFATEESLKKIEYAKKILGTEVKITDFTKEGEAMDAIGITKGKGIQGPVKRFGIRRKWHKSRKTVRQVGSIGGWTPHYVMYSVPRAGQMGFHQRTQYNKLVIKIGNNGSEVTPKGGYLRYGVISSDYVMLKGSVPGTTNRLVLIRVASRPPPEAPAPKIEYLHVASHQGD
jgi:large subunit ribosomal protein L3